MPHHAPASPADVPDPSARSRRAARFVLLSALAAGLLGLALPGPSGPEVVSLSAASTTAPSLLAAEPAVRHGVGVGVVAAPRRPAQRATRSRAAAPKARPAHRHQVARWVAPSGAGVVSPFGMRWGRMHKGIDFGAHYGAPIRAAGDGVVVGSGYLSSESGYGLITLVRHSNGIVTAYAHQSRSLVQAGERVTAGETIGFVGSSGHSTGAHLHFEVRTSTHGGQVDPRAWLREHGVYV